jgi:hypothetical protein
VENNFVVGFDTFKRLFMEKYYTEENSIHAFVEKLIQKNVHLYVAGRYNAQSQEFETFQGSEAEE